MTLAELIVGREGTPAEIAAWCNTSSVATRQLVPLWRIAELGRTAGWWLPVNAATDNPAAVAFMDYYSDSRFENLDMDLPAAQQAVGGLVATGLITPEQAAAVDALADVLVSPAANAGLSPVTAADVEIAVGVRPLVQQEPDHAE